MKEGTKSYLLGCHQFLLHPFWTLIAWRSIYGSWPKMWEIVCIFLHDVGIIGRQYLSNDNAKVMHWYLGALIAEGYFGKKGYDFVAGHYPSGSNLPKSKLWLADKRSCLVSPMFFGWIDYWMEFRHTKNKSSKPPIWRKLVAENLRTERPIDGHELYIKNRVKR